MGMSQHKEPRKLRVRDAVRLFEGGSVNNKSVKTESLLTRDGSSENSSRGTQSPRKIPPIKPKRRSKLLSFFKIGRSRSLDFKKGNKLNSKTVSLSLESLPSLQLHKAVVERNNAIKRPRAVVSCIINPTEAPSEIQPENEVEAITSEDEKVITHDRSEDKARPDDAAGGETKENSFSIAMNYSVDLESDNHSKCSKLERNADVFKVVLGDRDYIGFATLPEQIHRKSVKRGFDFTLMVVGESGLGKSTLINALFLSDLYKDRIIPDASEKISKTTTIERKMMDIEERGVKLRLTVVDTPGFGDSLNSEDSWKVVVNYIDDQFRQYFTDESGLNRKNIQDNRVHCCLYFIPPYGHGLRQIDVEFMKRVHQKVNIVPIIGKADTLTVAEVKRLKQRILEDIQEHGIQIYQFPECDSDEDEEFKQQDRELKASLPFSVIGSNTVIEIGGTRMRGRQYPWGVVEGMVRSNASNVRFLIQAVKFVQVENPKHSDFNKLRNMLITTHMQDLKDVTEDVHYENFRAQCISQISQQAFRERGKLKRDSVAPQDGNNITETDRLLLQKDEEIRRMQDMLAQMQQKLKATGQSNDNIVNI